MPRSVSEQASVVIREQGTALTGASSGLTSSCSLSDQRTEARVALIIKVFVQLSGKEVACVSSDLGIGGMGITVPAHFSPGTPVALHLSLGELCFMKLSGQVANCRSDSGNGGHVIGIKFCAMRDWHRSILSSVIEELTTNESTLSRSFATVYVTQDHLALETASAYREPSSSESQASSLMPKSIASRKAKILTPNPPWVIEMDRYLHPYRQVIWQSKLIRETSTGELSLAQVRGWSIQFYPFIELFPQFMATYLAKAPDPVSRKFLIDNLRVEKRHADQWIDMAVGFGVPRRELFETPIIPEVEALTHWMWSITNRGSFVEGVSAANFAIEGVTQGIAARMVKGFDKYHGSEGVELHKKSYSWMEAHSLYDDLHPYEALEVIKLHATSSETQHRVRHAAQRSLEYLFRALDACYWAYSPEPAMAG